MLSSYEDAEALAALQAPRPAKETGPLVRIESQSKSQVEPEATPQETR
jgi:hypothetical protein